MMSCLRRALERLRLFVGGLRLKLNRLESLAQKSLALVEGLLLKSHASLVIRKTNIDIEQHLDRIKQAEDRIVFSACRNVLNDIDLLFELSCLHSLVHGLRTFLYSFHPVFVKLRNLGLQAGYLWIGLNSSFLFHGAILPDRSSKRNGRLVLAFAGGNA